MKYFGKHGGVRTLVVEKQPFKGVENYFTDVMLYGDVHETSEELARENYDNNNELDSEPELAENNNFDYEINPFERDIDKLNLISATNEVGKWAINENLGFSYSLVVASDSMPSCTSTVFICLYGHLSSYD